jgi:hypothetical protein
MANGVYIGSAELVGAIAVLFLLCGTLVKLIYDNLKESQKEHRQAMTGLVDEHKKEGRQLIEELKRELKALAAYGHRFEIYVRIVEDQALEIKELRADLKRIRESRR